MALQRVAGPAALPVSLAEAKAHLRVDTSDDDTLIAALIAAATDFAERFLGRALIDQTWDLYLDSFPGNDVAVRLPLPPLIEVVGVFYLDSAGVEQEFAAAGYVVAAYSDPARIGLTVSGAWPAPKAIANAVRVRFRAGYIDASTSPAIAAVPPAIKAAILLTIGDLYANREETIVGTVVATTSFTVERLLRPYRFDLSLA